MRTDRRLSPQEGASAATTLAGSCEIPAQRVLLNRDMEMYPPGLRGPAESASQRLRQILRIGPGARRGDISPGGHTSAPHTPAAVRYPAGSAGVPTTSALEICILPIVIPASINRRQRVVSVFEHHCLVTYIETDPKCCCKVRLVESRSGPPLQVVCAGKNQSTVRRLSAQPVPSPGRP